MKRLLTTATVFLALSGAAFAADPVAGVWKSEPSDEGAYIEVTIAECGPQVCGTISKVVNGDASITGNRIIWDMDPKGKGKYRGGKVWAPDTDKTYRSKLDLSGNSLKVSGCVGPICRGQTWTRIK
ncbi:MAG: DUF2147 domain-containing protein [Pseudomonadota bacterium]